MAPKEWHYVTGCDSGFGSIVVKMLAEKGFGVFATHYLPGSAEELRKAHANIVPLHVDITNQESVDSAAARVRQHLAQTPGAQLCGLVNNAGLLKDSGPVEWTPPENYIAMFNVNVVGAVRVTNSLLPLLRNSKGRVVNVASIAGRFALPSQSAYCASKFAMEGYSDDLRREMIDWGVTVHIIEPGVFNKTALYNQGYLEGPKKLWEGIPPEVREQYGTAFRDEFGKRVAAALRDLGNSDSTLVPKAMVEALTAKKPKYRYRVGSDAKVLVPLMGSLHESWQDWIFRIRKPGEQRVLAADMKPEDADTALKRYDSESGLLRAVMLLALAKITWTVASKL
eukprot:TRINITY_DN56482_c0_g1_i1.p1 TRINITY_DN56482_c0_g1~~TRINITY_DN56482_c0_g1_i1.p1  ORF type:complete len:339 (+),score=133.74 TRINITY_DN56482_c0_g1_i1:85-1101(+)